MLKWVAFIITLTAAVISAAVYRWWHIRRTRIAAPDALSLIQQPQEDVSITRTAPDTLTLRWSRASPQVTIRLSTTAQMPFANPITAIAADTQTITIASLDPQQRYFAEIVFADGTVIVAAERVVPLASVPNFRDIGGYVTGDGRHVRWNRVYRASRLSNLSPEDAQTLHGMGVRLVCDLRTETEFAAEPDIIPAGIDFLPLPPQSDANRWVHLLRLLFQRDYLPNFLPDAYTRVMLDENPQIFGSVIRQLAHESNLPVVIHCAAGKDRSGLAIALILRLLGVPEEVVIADYTLSNHYYDFFRQTSQKVMIQLQLAGISPADFDYLLVADGRVLQYTFDHIRTHYGSVEHYLLTMAQIDTTTLEQVRRSLLE